MIGLECQVSVAGIEVFRRMHPVDAVGVERSFRQAGAIGATWRQEFRIIHPDRGIRTIRGNASVDRGADGDTLWYGGLRDVSDRDADGQERALSGLWAVGERYRLAMETLGQFVWEWEPLTDTVACDPRLATLLGEPGAVHFTGRDWREVPNWLAQRSANLMAPPGAAGPAGQRLV